MTWMILDTMAQGNTMGKDSYGSVKDCSYLAVSFCHFRMGMVKIHADATQD
jgi:hypothetical protein